MAKRDQAWRAEAHPIIRNLATATRDGRMCRREFMALASILGATAAEALALIGLPAPAAAQTTTPRSGGILRIGMNVRKIEDPRRFDWPEMANVARQFCETLVRWNADFSFSGLLLSGWEVSDDARTYTLNLREDVRWNNGDAFVADDVIFNLRRWCDTSVEGNSMASRMTTLIDSEAGQLAEGVVEPVDDHTIRLHLPTPDISIIAGMSDYPALIVHRDFDAVGDLAMAPVGTGPFELTELQVGERAAVTRRRDGGWWGGEANLDGVEFLDYGTDSTALVSAFEAGEIHVNDESPADMIDILDSLGLIKREKDTAQTIVARMNVNEPPYTDQRVRNAVQLAVDNGAVLNLALEGRGLAAEDHHVGPMHPEYAAVPEAETNVARARELLEEAGHADTELELISIQEGWQSVTMDAVAGQLRAARIAIKRTVIPGATFWNNWTKYPFSGTDWGARPLGVQVLALAYRSGAPWNETGFSDPEFDAKLSEALGIYDADERRRVMSEIERILQASGVIVQPFWRKIYLHHVESVHGYERHPSREMHLEQVWLEG